MPYFDTLGRVCGFLNVEEKEDSNQFCRRYFILDVNMGKMSYYMDDPSNLSEICAMPIREFNLQYISQVSNSKKIRPKVNFCFAIHVAGKKYYMQADNGIDQQRWTEALRNASKIQVPVDELSTSSPVWRQDATPGKPYITEIAGGVVCKLSDTSNYTEEGAADDTHSQPISPKSQSSPTIVKSGYCVKQGALRKNWKRRYFVLDTDGLSYFSNPSDKTRIKFIHKRDILDVRLSTSAQSSRENLFEVVTTKRTFFIQTDTEDEREDWVDGIRKVLRLRDGVSNQAVQGVDLLQATGANVHQKRGKPGGVWI